MTARRRIVMAAVAAGALAGAAAPAEAAVYPAGCSARLVAGMEGSCGWDSPTDFSAIWVAPVGTVKATVTCSYFGYTSSTSRTVSEDTSWALWTRGSCILSLAAVTEGASAVATALPSIPPVYDPFPR